MEHINIFLLKRKKKRKQKKPQQTSEKPHTLLFCLMPSSLLPPGLLILARIVSSFPSNSWQFLAGQDKFFPSLAFVWPYGSLPGIPSISPYESITPQPSLPYYFLSSKALWFFSLPPKHALCQHIKTVMALGFCFCVCWKCRGPSVINIIVAGNCCD